MGMTETNKELIQKYKVDDTILESYFKNPKNQNIIDVVFPLRIDNRQYCSPTDYQGNTPSCCGYSTAQILESMNWMNTGKIIQLDANQIYAKAKDTDKQLNKGGTYPDLAMMKGLSLVKGFEKEYVVKTSKSTNINELKRIIHKNMFACVNMKVTKDLYDVDSNGFVYQGTGDIVGGHSMVCCGYDEDAKMLIIQNHWGKNWGIKGFFLCPYSVWERQTNLTCWYERNVDSNKSNTREVEAPTKKQNKPKVDNEKKVEESKKEQVEQPNEVVKVETQEAAIDEKK